MEPRDVKKEPRLNFTRTPSAQASQKMTQAQSQKKNAVKRAQKAAAKTDKAVHNAEKAAAKADKAELKLPQKAVRRRYYNQETGKLEKGIQYQAKKPPKQSGGSLAPTAAAARAGLHKVESKLSEGSGSDPNEMSEQSTRLAKQTASGGMFVAEAAGHGIRKLDQARRLHPYQKAAKAEKKLAKKNVKALRAQEAELHPTSNPISKLAQRRKIKQSYTLRYRQDLWGKNAPLTKPLSWKDPGVGIKTFAIRKRQELAAVIKRYGLMLGGIGMIVVFLLSAVSSCGLVISGIAGSGELSAYQAADEDMLQAEAYYCSLEAELQAKIEHYEEEHEYDEYVYELDEIGHDPYVLISMLSAMYDEDEAWTFEDVQDDLDELFERQYSLTEEVTEEVRPVTPAEPPPTDPKPSEPVPTEPAPTDPTEPPKPGPDPRPRPPEPGPTPEPMAFDTKEDTADLEAETYDAKICTVTLVNANLSHLPVYYLSERELERYSVYMRSLGWRPDLFPDSPYVSLYSGGYNFYVIPTDALADEVFAAMMQEATKYLGYPYVWGGSTPETSFDCSGYVSWVINHTVVNDELVWGYIGRRGATGLYYLCTPTSTPHPGDLVFFEKTYVDTPDVICTHVGIYVGTDPETGHPMMIHCGDPIQFADLTNSYWQEHFFAYGHFQKQDWYMPN